MSTQVRYPGELKKGDKYVLKRYTGEVVELGEFKGYETNPDTPFLSYGSNTRLPNMLKFEKENVMDDMVFPPRLGGSGIFTVSKGGRKRKHSSKRQKKSTRKNRSKRNSVKSKHRRRRSKHTRKGRR